MAANEVVLWTGAGQIGMAIARRVAFGKKVVVGDKSLANAQTIAKVMNEAGFDVEPFEMDLSDREACAKLYRDLCDASIRKDAAGMAAILADDYVLVHMTGMRQSARDYIAAVLDGTLNYFSAEHGSIEARISPDGTSATIRARSRVNAAVFGGGRHTWRLQQDLTARKRNGVWLLTESRASTY